MLPVIYDDAFFIKVFSFGDSFISSFINCACLNGPVAFLWFYNMGFDIRRNVNPDFLL